MMTRATLTSPRKTSVTAKMAEEVSTTFRTTSQPVASSISQMM